MFNYIRKLVMAFTAKQVIVSNKEQAQTTYTNNDLSLEELALVLNVLKNADLKGHQVETFYNLIIKIQNQYIERQTK